MSGFNRVNDTYPDRIHEFLRLIYLSVASAFGPSVVRSVGSFSTTGAGTTASGTYKAVIFHAPSTNSGAVLVNNTPLEPGASRSYYVDREDFLDAIVYDTLGQNLYIEFMS